MTEILTTELFNFATELPLSHLRCLERIAHGAVTVGRYVLPANPGMLLGSSQVTVAIHESEPFDLSWRPPEEGEERRQRIVIGDIHINAADRPVFLRWRNPPRALVVALDRAFVERTVGEAFELGVSALHLRVGIRDSVIAALAMVWREELRERGAGGRLFAEGLAVALIIHLFRTYADGVTPLRPVRGGLGAPRLRRVNDYIEAHLIENISLRDLAGIAGLSLHHFGEAFKASTGRAPHHYLIERRIHRAKELLVSESRSITEIALAVGFASHSHFSVNFRKVTGMTPSRYRLEGR